MSIDEATVAKVARLARIRVTDEENIAMDRAIAGSKYR